MDVREEGGGGGGCREGGGDGGIGQRRRRGRREKVRWGIFFYYMWAPHKTHPTWRQVAKHLTAWLPHKHTNGQTSLTVQPGCFLNTLVTWSADSGLLLVQGAQRSSVVTSGAD